MNTTLGDGFVTFRAAIPNDWTQVALLITTSSNSSQASERYDFDQIEFRGVAVIPEPSTLPLANLAVFALAILRRRRSRANDSGNPQL